jgi:hypothetical protein
MRTALRSEKQNIVVAYVWVVDVASNEKVQLYVERIPYDQTVDEDAYVEDLLNTAATDWGFEENGYTFGDHGVAPLTRLLRGGNLQDALKQLQHADVAVIDTFSPRMSKVPKRTMAPKPRAFAQTKTAAFDSSTEGLLNELLGVLSDANNMIQRLHDVEQEIHEAKADGEPVAGEANDVIMLAKDVSGHLEAARDILLKRLDVFLGGKEKNDEEA